MRVARPSGKDREEHRERRADRKRAEGGHEGDREGGAVPERADPIPPVDAVDRFLGRAGPEQAAAIRRLAPDAVEGEREAKAGARLDRGDRHRRVRLEDVLGHERGGERDEGRCKEQHPVEEEEVAVDPADERKKVVVVDPDHEDRKEARDEREKRGRGMRKFPPNIARSLRERQEVDDEQRDGDREDAVAEGLDAPVLLLVGRGVGSLGRRIFGVPHGHRRGGPSLS